MRTFLVGGFAAALILLAPVATEPFSYPEASQIERRLLYEPGDWISYLNMTYVTSVTIGPEYVYFATTNGILRYHRYQRRWGYPHTTSTGLPDNRVYVVAYDPDTNLLWAATRAGVSFMNPATNEWRSTSKLDLNIASADRIVSIGIGEKGVWLETAFGYRILDKYAGFLVSESPKADSDIEWFGLRSEPPKLEGDFFISGGSWYLRRGQVGHIMDSHFREYEITSALVDEQLNLWYGTCGLGPGVGDLRLRSLELMSYGLLNTNVTGLAFDKEGRLWIGGRRSVGGQSPYITYGYGLCEPRFGITRWDTETDEWEQFESIATPGIRSDGVTIMRDDGRRLWVGTDAGLSVYDRKEGEWQTLSASSGLLADYVNDIAVGADIVWLATDFGVSTVKKASLNVERSFLKELGLLRVHRVLAYNREIWLGTDNGVFRVKENGNNIRHYNGFGERLEVGDRITNRITALTASDNRLWLADEIGISELALDSGEWNRLPGNPLLTGGRVRDLAGKGRYLWAATDNGVLRYDRENRYWTRYTTEDGLASNAVNRILLDEDYVWFGTESGLTQFYWNDPYRVDG